MEENHGIASGSAEPARLIEVSRLSKCFEEVEAVSEISFDVRRGEVFGFLGPNGAGKTTTINMLTGLARLDAGTIRIASLDCSADPKAAQYLIGVDILHGAIHGQHILLLWLDFLIIAAFGFALFSISLKNIHKKWII